jgi:stringent starvation protein B
MGFEVTDEGAIAPRHSRASDATTGKDVPNTSAQNDKSNGGKDEDPPPPRPHLTIVK